MAMTDWSGHWVAPELPSRQDPLSSLMSPGERAGFSRSLYWRTGYDTFGECWTWGTPVHGWSATPTRDLVAYVLGVTPDRPGFARARVAPRLGSLREAAGALPTPHGPVEVRVSGSVAEIDSPVPVVVVHEDGTEVELDAGINKVTVRVVHPSSERTRR